MNHLLPLFSLSSDLSVYVTGMHIPVPSHLLSLEVSPQSACYSLAAASLPDPCAAPTSLPPLSTISGLTVTAADFEHTTKHLLPVHLEYLRHWWGLLDAEAAEDGSPVTSTGFFSVPAGSCALW